MITVHSIRLDGSLIPGSYERYRDTAALKVALEATASTEYTDRVLRALEADAGVTLPNSEECLDVWETHS